LSSTVIITCVALYSALLFFVTWLTSRGATNETYFIGNRSSKWYIVAYGMIGASLSGVTFISVPGAVGAGSFAYFQVVLGYVLGYLVIAFILLPLYYKMQLTSIYSYLESRFGFWSYKTGSFFFILSRVIGASFRLYIVVNVLQIFVFDSWGVPFWITVLAFIILILLYTFEGGVRTIVYTDMLQTTFMLAALFLSVILICHQLNFSIFEMPKVVYESNYSQMFFSDWHLKNFFPKMFFGGMFIAIAMTGLDQEMMQKNISCKSLKEAQRNVLSFTAVLVVVNLIFLALGALLYIYANEKAILLPAKSDDLFPTIALNYLGGISAVFFVIGIISAAYPSADGALTALTTSFCFDMLGIHKNEKLNESKKKKIRYIVHFSFAALLLLVIVIFRIINDDAVIIKLFTVASYTYGPLLGLYSFGLFMNQKINDKLTPIVCITSVAICYLLNDYSEVWFYGYKFGFELIILNGFITFSGLYLISKKSITN
jgi:Na+/proline symporter